MNRLKVRSKHGTVSYITIKQSRNLRTHPFHGQDWESMAQVKKRVIRMGATLLGVRQK